MYFKDTIFAKNQKWSNRKRSTSQLGDITLDTCIKFEHYLIKTAGEEAFYSYSILYPCFKIQKFDNNSKIVWSSKKAQARRVISYLMPEWKFKNFPIKTVGKPFTVTIYYSIIPKFRQKLENNLIVKTSMSSDMVPGDTKSNWQKWLKITQMIHKTNNKVRDHNDNFWKKSRHKIKSHNSKTAWRIGMRILVPLFLRSDPCKVPEITISCKVQEILINPVFNQFSRKFQDYQRVPCIILLCIMKAVGSSGGVQMVGYVL